MGWTSYTIPATKTFNELLRDDFNTDGYEVIDSEITQQRCLNGELESAVSYAAIKHPKGYKFGLVILQEKKEHTNPNKAEYYYKDMDESVLPYYYDCPKRIIDKLSPVNELQGSLDTAFLWRKRCLENEKK